jgi:competence protein ComEC
MMRIAIPFALGICSAAYFLDHQHATQATLVLGCACMAALAILGHSWRYGHRWVPGAALMVLALVAGAWHQVSHTRQGFGPIPSAHVSGSKLLLRLEEQVGTSAKTHRYVATLLGAAHAEGLRSASGRLAVTVMRVGAEPPLAPGSIIAARGTIGDLDRMPNPGGFDPRAWYASMGVQHDLFVPNGQFQVVGQQLHWTAPFARAQRLARNWIAQAPLAPAERALAEALLLGVREDMDRSQRDAFVRSGTMHVLVVSGMHVAMLYSGGLWFFRRLFGKRTSALACGVVLIGLWAYAGLTGGSASVLRATIMCSFVGIAQLLGRRGDTLNALAASANLLMFWQPQVLFQLGFQLSFLAVLGIILLYPALVHAWRPKNFVLRYTWALLAVTLSAQVLATPLTLYAFQAFPVWFLPANLVVCTLVNVSIYAGMIAVALIKVPLVGATAGAVFGWLLHAAQHTTEWFAALPNAYPAVRLDLTQTLCAYTVVLTSMASRGWRLPWLRWAAATSALCALVGWAQHATATTARTRLVVFDDRRALHMAAAQGRIAVHWATPDTTRAQKVNERRVDLVRHWGLERDTLLDAAALLAKTMSVGTPSWLAGCGVLHFGGLHVWIIDRDTKALPLTILPHVIIAQGPGPFPEVLLQKLPKGVPMVLAPTMPARTRSFLRNWSENQARVHHDVLRDGAYILTL